MALKPTGREIAEALGVSAGRVSQLKTDGMPVDSVDAAEAWYRRRVDVARSFGQRHAAGRRPARPNDDREEDGVEGPSTTAEIGFVCVMARAFLEYGAPYLPALRSALADLQQGDLRFVAVPVEAWRALHGDEAPPAVREFVLLRPLDEDSHAT